MVENQTADRVWLFKKNPGFGAVVSGQVHTVILCPSVRLRIAAWVGGLCVSLLLVMLWPLLQKLLQFAKLLCFFHVCRFTI